MKSVHGSSQGTGSEAESSQMFESLVPVKLSDPRSETNSSVEALIEAFCKKGTKQVKEDLNVPRSTFDHADIRHQAFM